MQVILQRLARAPAETRLVLPAGQYEVGRAERCHIRLADRSVSRQHCLLSVTQDAAFVRDLGSRNGTGVNGQRVAGERRLAPGDHLAIASLCFRVLISLADCSDTGDLPEAPGAALGETIDGGRTR
jgi:pSer/pThr/pTyr-binding forkhead associated (FHA) protein